MGEIEKRTSDSYELPNNVLIAAPEPMVTVRTSTYQHGAYIKECIEGVLTQRTEFPFEFIVGEDFSTDGTREIVSEYANRYPDIIRVITADYNVGAKANSHRCRLASRGKYMAICEGDDYWTDPLKLQKQVDYLERHPECGLVHTDADYLYDETDRCITGWHRRHHRVAQGRIYEDLLLQNDIVTCTVCVRRNWYEAYEEEVAGKTTHFVMGDYPRWLFASVQSHIDYLDDRTAVRRIRGESVSKTKDIPRQYAFFRGRHDIQEFFMKKYPPSPTVEDKVQTCFHSRNLAYAYRMGNAKVASDSWAYLSSRKVLRPTDRLHWLGSQGRGCKTVARLLLGMKNTAHRMVRS